MGGRADFEERKELKKIKYEELAKKAKERSEQYMNSNANRILDMTNGQPIIIGHYSEKRHRKLLEKAHNDIKKSIVEDSKSKYYENKAESVVSNKVIYNDDPKAIEKINSKLEYLEKTKELIKADENHTTWQLQNISARIRELKRRKQALEKLENIDFDNKEFNGGKILHNKEINRIQIIFDDIPSEEIRTELKHRGFHWSRKECAWQRLFNAQTIKVTNILLEDVLNKEKEQEVEEEFE